MLPYQRVPATEENYEDFNAQLGFRAVSGFSVWTDVLSLLVQWYYQTGASDEYCLLESRQLDASLGMLYLWCQVTKLGPVENTVCWSPGNLTLLWVCCICGVKLLNWGLGQILFAGVQAT